MQACLQRVRKTVEDLAAPGDVVHIASVLAEPVITSQRQSQAGCFCSLFCFFNLLACEAPGAFAKEVELHIWSELTERRQVPNCKLAFGMTLHDSLICASS